VTSQITTDLLASLKSRPTGAVGVVAISIGGVDYQYAENWASVYEAGVVDQFEIRRSASDESFNLPQDTAQFSIRDDSARTLEKAIMANVGSVNDSAVNIYIASRTVTGWFLAFTGLVDSFAQSRPRVWTFNARRDDRALRRNLKIPYFQTYDWPNAPDATIGQPAPVVYGRHSSTATKFTGMLKAYLVDSSAFVYVVSFGLIADVTAVYVDGVESAATNWTFNGSYYNRGKYWSIVTFTGDQGTSVVTVDADGITDSGMIQNPGTMLDHIMSNFVFADWGASTTMQSSAWSSSVMQATYLSETEDYFTKKGTAAASRVIDGTRTGLEILNGWCKSHQVPAFWSYFGLLATRPDDHTDGDYITSPHFRPENMPRPEDIGIEFDAQKLTDEVQVEYILSTADGQYQKQLAVVNGSKGYNAPESLPLPWREGDAVDA